MKHYLNPLDLIQDYSNKIDRKIYKLSFEDYREVEENISVLKAIHHYRMCPELKDVPLIFPALWKENKNYIVDLWKFFKTVNEEDWYEMVYGILKDTEERLEKVK